MFCFCAPPPPQCPRQEPSTDRKVVICRCYPLCICERADAAASSAERVNSSWLGGSILASLGTFHQVRQPPSPSLHNIPRYLSLSLSLPLLLSSIILNPILTSLRRCRSSGSEKTSTKKSGNRLCTVGQNELRQRGVAHDPADSQKLDLLRNREQVVAVGSRWSEIVGISKFCFSFSLLCCTIFALTLPSLYAGPVPRI